MPPYATRLVDHRRARDEPIAEALVIPFSMIVLDVLCYRATEVLLPDRNQPVEAFFLDRSHEAFRVSGWRKRCVVRDISEDRECCRATGADR